jgi:hypothetical protein
MMMFTPATKSSKSKPPKGNLILQTTVVAQIMYWLVFQPHVSHETYYPSALYAGTKTVGKRIKLSSP